MSAAKKQAAKAGGDEASAPAFEEGLAQLEGIVDALESGELALEEGVARYKQGVELLAVLQGQLRGAEERVDALTEQLRETLAEIEADDGDEDED